MDLILGQKINFLKNFQNFFILFWEQPNKKSINIRKLSKNNKTREEMELSTALITPISFYHPEIQKT